ncbi:MAG: hypothetical protein IH597_15090 [Bacteroidales bacterium]|nr:hypothetical protein [Bacteroidales bacterium]
MFSAYSFPGFTGTSAIRHNIPLNNIEKAVCEAFFVTPEKLREKNESGELSRKREIVKARHTFYWLGKKYTLHSLARLGIHFNQDHASVLHSIRQVDNMIDSKDKAFLPLIKHAETLLLPFIIKGYENQKANTPIELRQRIKPPRIQPANRIQNPRRCKPALPGTRTRTIAPPYFRTSLRVNATT